MSDYQIGKVVGVTGDEIFVTLVDHEPSADSERGVPDSMTIPLQTAAGPTPVLMGQPGTFITVARPAGKLLCMVTGIEMREGKVSSSESREAEADGTMLLDRATRGLSAIPVGTIDASGKFERGTDVLPTVNAPVFAVSPALIDQVYASYAEGDFAIGKLSLLPGQLAKINLDAFLTRHA